MSRDGQDCGRRISRRDFLTSAARDIGARPRWQEITVTQHGQQVGGRGGHLRISRASCSACSMDWMRIRTGMSASTDPRRAARDRGDI
jgi:hypothetical protein